LVRVMENVREPLEMRDLEGREREEREKVE
jgi:hypothetical protein